MNPLVVGVLGVGLVDAGRPVLFADDLGLERGDGCFEGVGVRLGADGRAMVADLDAHLARMRRSAAALDIAFDEAGWRSLVTTCLPAWTTPGDAVMRLLLTRGRPGLGPTGVLTIKPAPAVIEAQLRDGVRVVTLPRGTTSDAYVDAPWLLGGVKTLSYAVNMAAGREAIRRGAEDVIFLSTDGAVLEAPTATVVWAVGGTLRTTPVGATGILPGTTQQRLFATAKTCGWQVESVGAVVDDLHAARAVWLVSAGRGPVDVVELDGKGRARDLLLNAEIRRLAGF
ncbi:MAG: aminotransferase class IV [Actinomycetota bacterium]